MRGTLAALALLAVLLAASPLTGAPAGLDPSPATVGTVVVGRYDLQRTGVAQDVGAITSPIVRWTFRTNGTIATSPLAADLDGDGAVEIFFGEFSPADAADGSRHGYVLDGQGRVEHVVPMRFNGVAAAAADLDGDGGMDFLFSQGSHTDVSGGIGYAAFRGKDGTPLWTFTTPFFGGEGFFASPAVADVDGDGGLDLIAGSMDHTVYALRGADASVLWRTPGLEHYVRHSTPMADLDGDGDPDVVVHTEEGTVHAFDAALGTESWSRDLGDIVASTPAIGDLDGDGRLDAVYSLIVAGGHVALSGDGTVLWRNEAHDFAYRSPALVDVDGDGLVDVVDGDADDPSITAYRGTDGSVLWDVPLAAPWASGPIVAADTDGDGAMEILAGSDAGLTALDAATGATEWFLPLPPIRGEPLVKDVDGDGLAEILVGAGDGRLYVLGTPEAADATLRVEPRTLNLRSHGRWVNARITYDEPVAKDVVAGSLHLEGIPADRVQVLGATTIHAKFSREALVKVLEPGERVEVCATGVLTDGRTFRACDTIRVLGPKK